MNLIITCPRHLEPDTEDELKDILEEFGDSDAKVLITKMSRILTTETKHDPIEVVRKIKEMILSRASELEIKNAARAHGMRTMREDAVLKACAGLTTLEEVVRLTAND